MSQSALIGQFQTLGFATFKFPHSGIIRKILWDINQYDNDVDDVLPITYRMFSLYAQHASPSLPQGATGPATDDLILTSSEPLGLVDLNLPIGNTINLVRIELRFGFGQYTLSHQNSGDNSIFQGFVIIEFDDMMEKSEFRPIGKNVNGFNRF
jgi:hypothetical protein